MFYFSKARWIQSVDRIKVSQNVTMPLCAASKMLNLWAMLQIWLKLCCKWVYQNSWAGRYKPKTWARKINQHFVQTIIIWDQLWLKDNRSVFPSQNNVKLWHCFLPWNMKLWQMQMQLQPCWSPSVSFLSLPLFCHFPLNLWVCVQVSLKIPVDTEMKSESNPPSLSGLCCCSPPLGTSPPFGSFGLFRASSSPSSCRKCACTSWNKRSEKPAERKCWPPPTHPFKLTYWSHSRQWSVPCSKGLCKSPGGHQKKKRMIACCTESDF